MNSLSRAHSYISLVLFKKSSYVTSQIPWNKCFYMPSRSCSKPAGLSAFHSYSSKSKTAKSKMSSDVPLVDKEKDAFFVVGKGENVGIYKDLSEFRAQVGSSVSDPPFSVYKGYSLPKDAEKYLSSVGLKKPLYSFKVSDLKKDMFGTLTPCLVLDHLPSASMSVDPTEKLHKLEPSVVSAGETCIIEFDGASKGNPGRSGAAAILRTEDGSLICKVCKGLGIATTNVAERNGLILGLNHAIVKGYKKIKVKGDSKLVCMQVNGQWKVNRYRLLKLHQKAKQLSQKCLFRNQSCSKETKL